MTDYQKGRPSRKYGITWSEPVSKLLYLAPYILGVLPKVVEVKLLDTQTTVQSLALRASLGGYHVSLIPSAYARSLTCRSQCVV